MQNRAVQEFSLEIYKKIVEYDELGVFEWDLASDEIKCDANLYNILGSTFPMTAFSKSLKSKEFIHNDDVEMMQEFLNFISMPHNRLANQEYTYKWKYRFRHKNGKYVWLKVMFVIYFKGNRAYKVIGAMRNIDQQQQMTEKLKIEAERDSLTGLYNKRYVQKVIDSILTKPEERHAMLVIDLDGFKDVNDTFGHLFGDAVITETAMTITSVFRSTDIIGRIGGDEFIVFMRNVMAIEVVEKKCSMLCQALRKSYETNNDDEKINISASIGVALYPKHGVTFDEVFINADTALYNSKFKGKDIYSFYSPEMETMEMRAVDEVDLFNSRSFREHAIEFVFNLLYETKNVNTTIDMMLSLIGRHFKLSRVFIYAYDYKNNLSQNVFEWTSGTDIAPASQVYSQEMMDIVIKQYHEASYGLFAECNDIKLLSDSDQEVMKKVGVKAFLHCQIHDRRDKIGCIGFDDCLAPHLWSKREHEVLSVFSRILGYFLLRQTKIEELLSENAKLHSVLNRGFAYIYVIDKDTHDILYMNHPFECNTVGRLTVDKCYEVIFNHVRPCEDCILKELKSSDHTERLNMMDSENRLFFDVDAYNIEWDERVDAALLIVRLGRIIKALEGRGNK